MITQECNIAYCYQETLGRILLFTTSPGPRTTGWKVQLAILWLPSSGEYYYNQDVDEYYCLAFYESWETREFLECMINIFIWITVLIIKFFLFQQLHFTWLQNLQKLQIENLNYSFIVRTDNLQNLKLKLKTANTPSKL